MAVPVTDRGNSHWETFLPLYFWLEHISKYNPYCREGCRGSKLGELSVTEPMQFTGSGRLNAIGGSFS